MATATAMTDCEIMRLEKEAMIRVLHDEPAFSEMFVSHLLARTIRVEADLVDQLFNSSEKRLARALLLLANFGKEGRPEPIIAKVSQETLAEMIGTTRSRVSHFMNKFRQLGFIDYNGSIEVHSSLLSVVLADQSRSVKPTLGHLVEQFVDVVCIQVPDTVFGVVLNWRAAAAWVSLQSTTARTIASRPLGVRRAFLWLSIRSSANRFVWRHQRPRSGPNGQTGLLFGLARCRCEIGTRIRTPRSRSRHRGCERL